MLRSWIGAARPDRTCPDLLSLLQSGVERSGADRADRLEISDRTLRRDANRLRQLGYAINARPGPAARTGWPRACRLLLLIEEEEITAVVARLRWVQVR